MLGLMQNQPLMISSLIEHANRHHNEVEIVSRRVEGDIHRTTYGAITRRSRQLAHALDALQLGSGDRVATLAWNGYRHLELYFGVSGTGRVLHTLNPRLHPDQIAAGNEIFSPRQDEYDHAELILEAYHWHTSTAGGARGAVMLGEEMIDEASRKMALVIAGKGRAAGMTRQAEPFAAPS